MSMNERIQKRLRKNRPMATISIRVPEDVIDDLKDLAPSLGFSGYQPLIRSYIGQGIRRDLVKLENDEGKLQVINVIDSLRRHGIADNVIDEVISESKSIAR